jgi:hypothetical protein
MANKHKGEVSAEIAGTAYTFMLGSNEWCQLEEEYDKTTDEIMADFYAMVESGKVRMKTLRAFFRVSLTFHHPDITHEDAGRLMDKHGLAESAGLIGRVIMAGMPEDDAEANVKPRPRKAARA